MLHCCLLGSESAACNAEAGVAVFEGLGLHPSMFCKPEKREGTG